MTTAFSELSIEGKLAKLAQHIAGGHPVPSQWVSWLVNGFVPSDIWPVGLGEELPAFANLDDSQKLAKIAYHLHEGTIPAYWVEWLSDEFVSAKPAPPRSLPRP
jgi:hypothetical protein